MLRRYRVARTRDFYLILDHGKPNGRVKIPRDQAGEGKLVPKYAQDGDPTSLDTSTFVVYRSYDASPEAKAETRRQCNELNAEWESESDEHDEVLSELNYEVEEVS